MEIPEPDPPVRPRGLFVSLDGPDGGGKTTQAATLAAWFCARGIDAITCRDPGGTPVGDRLRQIVLDRDNVELALRAEMLIYMASRAQLVEEVIRPALEAGKVVVSDRYLLANLVYQGFAGGLPIDEIGQVGRIAIGGLFPDLTILLDVPAEVARARGGRARDRIEDRPESYHARVRSGFLEAARDAQAGACRYYPASIVVLDGSADRDAVAERIRSEVERALALRPRP